MFLLVFVISTTYARPDQTMEGIDVETLPESILPKDLPTVVEVKRPPQEHLEDVSESSEEKVSPHLSIKIVEDSLKSKTQR